MTLPTSGPLTFSDIQTEFGGTNPIALNEYYAGGGLVPAGTSGTYGAVPSSGQISVQNFYGTTAYTPVYIEDIFSTFIYTGISGSNVTINNGINLSGNGGLIWTKGRNEANPNSLTDTVRGVSFSISTNTTSEQAGSGISSFTSTGYVTNTQGQTNGGSAETYVSRTFQKQAKFFDIVTYTGNGSTQTISHNLGSVPGCIMVKNTSNNTTNWPTYHKGYSVYGGSGNIIQILNGTNAAFFNTAFNNTMPTSTNFQVGLTTTSNNTNTNGNTYVAYLFASNAGGFGATGTDNIITCDYYTGNGSADGPEITLGYEPQWVMIKSVSDGNWLMLDIMRGFNTYTENELYANLNLAEGSGLNYANPTVTGFKIATAASSVNANGTPFIYIAIRRGPMKVPTVGTSIFYPSTAAAGTQIPTGFNADLWIGGASSGDAGGTCQITVDRMRGPYYFGTTNTNSQSGTNNSFIEGRSLTFKNITQGGATRSEWLFGRAPGFFEIVQYTGVDQFAGEYGFASRSVTHGLKVAPELMIIKSMDAAVSWYTYVAALGNSSDLFINSSDAKRTGVVGFNAFTPTSTTFQVNAAAGLNTTGGRYIAYLFATVAGVSKVGSYTGTGSLQTVNCGFTTGARYIIIKRTDSAGDWYVYNSANGISSGNDPYMLLNSSAALVTGTNYVDTTSVGFQVTAAAPAGLNANGGTYIFLAIA